MLNLATCATHNNSSYILYTNKGIELIPSIYQNAQNVHMHTGNTMLATSDFDRVGMLRSSPAEHDLRVFPKDKIKPIRYIVSRRGQALFCRRMAGPVAIYIRMVLDLLGRQHLQRKWFYHRGMRQL